MENKVKQNLDFTGQNIYIGLDTHLKTWRTTIRVGDSFFGSTTIFVGREHNAIISIMNL